MPARFRDRTVRFGRIPQAAEGGPSLASNRGLGEPRDVAAERIPSEGPRDSDERDLYGDFRALVRVSVRGRDRWVPESNHLLRALQFLSNREGDPILRWGRFCWDNTRACCDVRYRAAPGGPERRGRACRLQVAPGLEILTLPEGTP